MLLYIMLASLILPSALFNAVSLMLVYFLFTLHLTFSLLSMQMLFVFFYYIYGLLTQFVYFISYFVSCTMM